MIDSEETRAALGLGAAVQLVPPSNSPAALALRRFRKHRLALFGMWFLVALVIVAVSAPITAPYDPAAIDLDATESPPNSSHLLGTDSIGRDVLSRLMHGTHVSLVVGFVAALLSTVMGLLLGLTAGYFRGTTDAVISRVTEIVLSFPFMIGIIVIVAIVGAGQFAIVLGVGLMMWPTACRIVRGQVLSLREQDFILAARAVGASDGRIMIRHLVPSVLGPLAVFTTLTVATAILLEASLSFIGLRIRPPQASWGSMMREAQSLYTLESMPWLWLPPGIAIALTILAVNFVGDGLRDALDPRQRVRD